MFWSLMELKGSGFLLLESSLARFCCLQIFWMTWEDVPVKSCPACSRMVIQEEDLSQEEEERMLTVQ